MVDHTNGVKDVRSIVGRCVTDLSVAEARDHVLKRPIRSNRTSADYARD